MTTDATPDNGARELAERLRDVDPDVDGNPSTDPLLYFDNWAAAIANGARFMTEPSEARREVEGLLAEGERTAGKTYHGGHASKDWWQGAVAHRFPTGEPCRLPAGHEPASWHNGGPPTRPESFDPRDANPLTVEPDERQREIDGYIERYYASGRWDWEPRPDRRSRLSVLGFLVLFWAAVGKIAGWWTL